MHTRGLALERHLAQNICQSAEGLASPRRNRKPIFSLALFLYLSTPTFSLFLSPLYGYWHHIFTSSCRRHSYVCWIPFQIRICFFRLKCSLVKQWRTSLQTTEHEEISLFSLWGWGRQLENNFKMLLWIRLHELTSWPIVLGKTVWFNFGYTEQAPLLSSVLQFVVFGKGQSFSYRS